MSGCAGGGSARSKPGSRNDAGETLCDALMPLHPLPNNTSAGTAAHRAIFQFNLIEYSV